LVVLADLVAMVFGASLRGAVFATRVVVVAVVADVILVLFGRGIIAIDMY
jgi:hypothetical protein